MGGGIVGKLQSKKDQTNLIKEEYLRAVWLFMGKKNLRGKEGA